MNRAAEVIVACLKEQGMTQIKLAMAMGEDIRRLSQQLNQQNDLKVERFIDVLDHIGYRVEIVNNGGIRKVSSEYASQIIETREPRGMFWTVKDGVYTGIDNTAGDAFCEDFSSKEECFAWLYDEA